jgi:hypothetical protein
MADTGKSSDFVVVAVVGTLRDADVTRMVLEGFGIQAIIIGESTTNVLAHVSLGLNPRGVRLAVPANDVPRALEIIADDRGVAGDDSASPRKRLPPTRAEEYAQRAFWAALMSWFFPILLPAVIYDLVKARQAAGEGGRRLRDPRRYRRDMTKAMLLFLPLAVGILGLMILGVCGIVGVSLR